MATSPINRCQMYLKISTTSDIASPCRTKLYDPRVDQYLIPVEDSRFNWPTQECPKPKYWKIWHAASRMLLNQDKNLTTPLGDWHTTPRQRFPWCVDTAEKKIYKILPTHAIVHWRKLFHRSSSRGHKEYILRGRNIHLIEVPRDTLQQLRNSPTSCS